MLPDRAYEAETLAIPAASQFLLDTDGLTEAKSRWNSVKPSAPLTRLME